jgi:hypothetical protein
MAITLWTGNEVYMHLTVAFIQVWKNCNRMMLLQQSFMSPLTIHSCHGQMLKAFTPVITMIALFIARLEDPTTKMIFSVLLTALGTATAAYGEINLSIIGVCIMYARNLAPFNYCLY